MSVASRRAAPAETNVQSTPSGRLLLRMPRTLHRALTEEAEREGTSLNQFITGTLASAIGWIGDGAEGKQRGAPRLAPRADRGPSRTLVLLLVANAVAVGLAALGAIGILLLAWLG